MINCYRRSLQSSFICCRRLTVYDHIPTTPHHRCFPFEFRFLSCGKSNWYWNGKTEHFKQDQQNRLYGCGHFRAKKDTVKYFREVPSLSSWTKGWEERLRYFIYPCDREIGSEMRLDILIGYSRIYMTINDPKKDTTTKVSGVGLEGDDNRPAKRSASSADNVSSATNINRGISENIWTIPNLLCVARMGMAPLLGYMVLNSQFGPAVGLLFVAGFTDLLDGWIARVVPGQSSMMGSFLDPMADKILIGTLFLSLTYINLIPIPLTALVIGRDAFLMGAGFYIRYQSLEPPRTFSRYFDVTSPSAQLAPTFISKVNTGVQLSLIGATLLSTLLPVIEHSHLVFIWYCTGGSTVLSALSYVFARDTYKVIKKMPSTSEDKDKGMTKGR